MKIPIQEANPPKQTAALCSRELLQGRTGSNFCLKKAVKTKYAKPANVFFLLLPLKKLQEKMTLFSF